MNKIVQNVIEICNPLQVFVFGSTAKGTQHAKSDLDLLIVVEDSVNTETLYERLNESGLLKANDLIIRKSSEFKANKSDITKIDLVVNLEGKLIYQKPD